MATRRSGWNELRRLLDSVAAPWCVVGAQRRIVWCNQALARAVELESDDLVNRECRYHTPDDTSRAQAIAAALCPPPELDPRHATSNDVSWLATSGIEVRYRATFAPLVESSNVLSSEDDGGVPPDAFPVFVTLHGPLSRPTGDDRSSESILMVDDPSPAALHDQVRSFRLTWGRRYHVDRLVGTSCHAQRIREQVEMASDAKGAVLIVGPEGSGRRHIARAIHYSRGESRAGRLIHLSATALSPDALQSAVKGLTATVDSRQRQPVATLLLADVDQLPDDLQLQLETLLAGRHAGMRLIATAKQPLDQLVGESRFRRRLALRLAVLSIELPSLGERREDVPLMAQLFVEEFNAQQDKQFGGFEEAALDQLAAYPWPGEVAELRGVVVEACRQSTSPLIPASDLPRKIAHGLAAAARPSEKQESIQLDDFLARIESEVVLRAMHQARGNKSKAATLLGMTRPRLYRRLVQLGLESDA